MGLFAGNKRISHDGYEFMNKLYTQRFDDYLRGVPIYFYLVFTGVKLPLLSLVGFIIGLPLLFRRKLGDGRYFILFWFLLWVVAFCFPGGKFTRYYTTVLPAVLITAALGIQHAGRWLAEQIRSVSLDQRLEALRGRRAWRESQLQFHCWIQPRCASLSSIHQHSWRWVGSRRRILSPRRVL